MSEVTHRVIIHKKKKKKTFLHPDCGTVPVGCCLRDDILYIMDENANQYSH